jgi:hypothetical protein
MIIKGVVFTTIKYRNVEQLFVGARRTYLKCIDLYVGVVCTSS